ncbi:unnamed protein product [Porites lobata]|uniref:BTB domain-containing protein n=1 Tax=Porites lobata TaxID=104759 RepID=A0ABN8NRQ8_9CNID|nr:unnamed protein product [Porites lobata]
MYQFKKDEHAQLLLKHLAVMQANRILTDLTVRTKSKDHEETFHSVLLAANSPFIRRSLTGKRFDCTSGVIPLDLTQQQLEAFLDFVYKSELPTDQGVVNGLRHFASRYEMTYLEELCQERGLEREGHERMTVLSKRQEDVLSQLHDMREKKELTTTYLEDCDGSFQFAVHGPLLAAASPVFQDIFSDDLLSQEGSRYRLKDVTCNTLGDLINFIYTGEVTLEEENVVDLLHAAYDYEIPTLARACCDWLEVQLSSYNAIGIWLLAREQQSEYISDLEEIAKSYIIANFTSVCREDEFLELEYEDLEEIIRNDYLGVQNEEEVFAAVVNWIKADEGRSSFFCDLLNRVRLECASSEFLCDMEKDPHVANCSQCLQVVQRAQAKKIQASNRTPEVTRLHYDDEADFKRNLLYEFLESTRVNDDHLNETTEETPPREPRKSKEKDMRLKQNRHGQLNKDGSPDMRFKVNRRHLNQRNLDGTPDRRHKGNKESNRSTQKDAYVTTEGPLTKTGKPDMRFKVNKEAYGQSSSQKSTRTPHGESKRKGVPLKKDGTPDMRYTVNKTPESVNSALPGNGATPLKRDGTPDMRFAVNKPARKPASPAPSYSSSSGPLKNDGTPDMRYAANKSSYDSPSSSGFWSGGSSYGTRSLASLGSPGPLKSDGTPDMRYAANRSSYSSPSSYSGSSYSVSSSSSGSSFGAGPLKSDGTPDMRYAANRSSYSSPSSYSGSSYSVSSSSSGSSFGAGPLKSDGTPDMRYASNRSSYGSSSSFGGSSYSSISSSSGSSFGGSSSCGPLKSNGTPDMRYASNRSSYGGSSYSSISSSSGSSFGGSSSCGPLKSNGTPDMRYASNRSSYGGSSYSSRSSSRSSSRK